MHICIGLGNPGSKYTRTRHNIGFRCVEALAQKCGVGSDEWKEITSLQAHIVEVNDAMFVKPQTFMNESGKAVHAVLKKYAYPQLANKDFHSVYIFHDDLDLEVGNFKILFGKRPKTHNGLDSIQQTIGSDQVWYVRLGVDDRRGDRSIPPDQYVLHPFPEEEESLVEHMVSSVVEQMYATLSS
jgi:peptidyl-tRNA hydrolase, PTH1 family